MYLNVNIMHIIYSNAKLVSVFKWQSAHIPCLLSLFYFIAVKYFQGKIHAYFKINSYFLVPL